MSSRFMFRLDSRGFFLGRHGDFHRNVGRDILDFFILLLIGFIDGHLVFVHQSRGSGFGARQRIFEFLGVLQDTAGFKLRRQLLQLQRRRRRLVPGSLSCCGCCYCVILLLPLSAADNENRVFIVIHVHVFRMKGESEIVQSLSNFNRFVALDVVVVVVVVVGGGGGDRLQRTDVVIVNRVIQHEWGFFAAAWGSFFGGRGVHTTACAEVIKDVHGGAAAVVVVVVVRVACGGNPCDMACNFGKYSIYELSQRWTLTEVNSCDECCAMKSWSGWRICPSIHR
mmetsp:Transcript_10210/g.22463  ORF Transcript_10210/g.22463 Transcript_10210/m.22463 type:complete len:282 (-) Transcript_10210:161-1006(-)